MPKFRFELEPLLTARRNAEESRQREVAGIERERMTIEHTLRKQQSRIDEGKQSLRSSLIGKIDAESLRLHAGATMQQMRQAQRLVLELAGVHRRLDTARAALIEAARHRRAVELLRERRLELWNKMQEKAETDAMDELAVIAASRTKSPVSSSTLG